MKTVKQSRNLLFNKSKLDFCLKDIPNKQGCYLMLDKEERILYVGKSKTLNKRVKSYFNTFNDLSARIKLMVSQVTDIEIIITDNEKEALTLESNLIKTNKPYFNILLKDDKKYPYICITWSELYPRIFLTRKRKYNNTRDKYYGPYVDVTLLRKTLFSIKSVFPLRQRPIPLYKDRTCLYYSIKRCPGVCQEKISPEDYRKVIKDIELIFQGRSDQLKNILIDKMNNYSENLEYELALKIRDQIKGLDHITDGQKMTLTDSSVSRDIIAMSSKKDISSIQLFQMRSGKLVGRLGYISRNHNETDEYIMQKIIEEHYSKVDPIEIPNEILTQYLLPQKDIINNWISNLKGKKIKILNPKRGEKSKIIELVYKNSNVELDKILHRKEQSIFELEDLSQLLELNSHPRRIEGYDISHIQGSDAVGSQVVFIDGIPAKQHYRKYKIKNEKIISGYNNDYLAIAEVIERRFKKWANYKDQGGTILDMKNTKTSILNNPSLNDWPDLIVIDGGKGQLSSAYNTLKKLGLADDLNVCSLAKMKEEIYIPEHKYPINHSKDEPGVQLLRKLRNESHRFAVTYHKLKRSNRMTRSTLDNIKGLGKKRINLLLVHFKSIDSIKLATLDELKNVEGLGSKIAIEIRNYFDCIDNV